MLMNLGLALAALVAVAWAVRVWARRGHADLMSDQWLAGHLDH